MYPVARIKAAYRFIMFHLFRSYFTEWNYDNTSHVDGYQGGFNLHGKTLVFKRGDGSLQYFW